MSGLRKPVAPGQESRKISIATRMISAAPAKITMKISKRLSVEVTTGPHPPES